MNCEGHAANGASGYANGRGDVSGLEILINQQGNEAGARRRVPDVSDGHTDDDCTD